MPCPAAGLATALLLMAGTARAADIGQYDGFDVRWDTTVRDTLAFREQGANPSLLADINADDGDRSFKAGLISARLDIFSEATIERGQLGFDISAQGWYDPEYLRYSANSSAQTFNPVSVPNYKFPPAVQTLMGDDAELLSAFVKDGFSVGDVPVSVRIGRQTLLWGESLFFPNNGIAASQAPVDVIKSLSAPLAEARELYLPVTQAVIRAELRPGLALEAFDQFEWRRDRLPGVASYFSTTDILDVGGQQYFLPGGFNSLYRARDTTPHGIGQFGAALRLQGDDFDYGFYGVRYDSKAPQPIFDFQAGTYKLVFPTGIYVIGASVSSYLGDSTLAGEISVRQHMPLVSGGTAQPGNAGAGGGASAYATVYADAYAGAFLAAPPAPSPLPRIPPNGGLNSGFATGNTWHAQTSIVSQLPPSRWWQGATVQAEIAANDLLEVTGGHDYVQAGRTHFAASLQAVLTPSYFRVLPGLDISLPLGLGYTPIGRSSIDASQNAGSGNVTASVSATYRAVWQAVASVTHFIGGAGSQRLADRDFVALSVMRSF